jgi:hypothetical protein
LRTASVLLVGLGQADNAEKKIEVSALHHAWAGHITDRSSEGYLVNAPKTKEDRRFSVLPVGPGYLLPGPILHTPDKMLGVWIRLQKSNNRLLGLKWEILESPGSWPGINACPTQLAKMRK